MHQIEPETVEKFKLCCFCSFYCSFCTVSEGFHGLEVLKLFKFERMLRTMLRRERWSGFFQKHYRMTPHVSKNTKIFVSKQLMCPFWIVLVSECWEIFNNDRFQCPFWDLIADFGWKMAQNGRQSNKKMSRMSQISEMFSKFLFGSRNFWRDKSFENLQKVHLVPQIALQNKIRTYRTFH